MFDALSKDGYLAVHAPREADVLKYEQFLSKDKFSKEDISNFITTFINESFSAEELDYKDVESVFQRICNVPYLQELIYEPHILGMTLHVLPYLEKFYQNKENINSALTLRKDIYHFFTNLILNDMARIVQIQNNGLSYFGRISIPEVLLKFNCTIAALMNNKRLTELNADEIKLNNNEFKKFFTKLYEPTLFNGKISHYRFISIGREYSFFLRDKSENTEQPRYAFLHQVFLDYFATLLPQTIAGRRFNIVNFMAENPVAKLDPRSIEPINEYFSPHLYITYGTNEG